MKDITKMFKKIKSHSSEITSIYDYRKNMYFKKKTINFYKYMFVIILALQFIYYILFMIFFKHYYLKLILLIYNLKHCFQHFECDRYNFHIIRIRHKTRKKFLAKKIKYNFIIILSAMKQYILMNMNTYDFCCNQYFIMKLLI